MREGRFELPLEGDGWMNCSGSRPLGRGNQLDDAALRAGRAGSNRTRGLTLRSNATARAVGRRGLCIAESPRSEDRGLPLPYGPGLTGTGPRFPPSSDAVAPA